MPSMIASVRAVIRDAIYCHKVDGSSTLSTTLFRDLDLTTIADPFLCVQGESIYLFVELEGYRLSGSYFKKIGIFKICRETLTAEYLGESWPDDDGEYSFPFVFRHNITGICFPIGMNQVSLEVKSFVCTKHQLNLFHLVGKK